tara:strand:+ start:205 stop:405 length:201 start_codon:yes stop_codon:yes gene_type:complete
MDKKETYQIKIAKLLPNEYGNNDIVISMISKYKDSKFEKHVKLDKDILNILLKGVIHIDMPENEKQ